MTLFEIFTGYIGESHERAYAWAADEGEARWLYEDRNPHRSPKTIQKLLDHEYPSFCTKNSDSGWEE